jgi:hypothetical protein
MKIETSCDTQNRWTAYIEGTLDGGETNVVGSGTSESEAIEDLLEKHVTFRSGLARTGAVLDRCYAALAAHLGEQQ